MEQVLTIVLLIFITGVIMPFLVMSGCLMLERQLTKRRECKRTEIIQKIDEALAGTLYGFLNGNCDKEWLSRDSIARGLKALIYLQLTPRQIRFIKSEYIDCDKWIENKIRFFIYNESEKGAFTANEYK